MRVLASSLIVGTFLVLIAMPDRNLASPIKVEDTCTPVVHKTCGTWCENNCEVPNAESLPCLWNSCRPGYFCKPGYVKEFKYGYGRCILKSECPPVRPDTTTFTVTGNNDDTTTFPVTGNNDDTTTFPVIENHENSTTLPVIGNYEDTIFSY